MVISTKILYDELLNILVNSGNHSLFEAEAILNILIISYLMNDCLNNLTISRAIHFYIVKNIG